MRVYFAIGNTMCKTRKDRLCDKESDKNRARRIDSVLCGGGSETENSLVPVFHR